MAIIPFTTIGLVTLEPMIIHPFHVSDIVPVHLDPVLAQLLHGIFKYRWQLLLNQLDYYVVVAVLDSLE